MSNQLPKHPCPICRAAPTVRSSTAWSAAGVMLWWCSAGCGMSACSRAAWQRLSSIRVELDLHHAACIMVLNGEMRMKRAGDRVVFVSAADQEQG